MNFGFVTCVELGLACMQEIYNIDGKLDLVVTLKDNIARNKSGRVYIDEFCEQNNISQIVKIRNVNDVEVIDAIKERHIDWLFIIGWSQIARQEVLDAPKKGVLGMHPTLLPVGRGRASIPWAIIKNLEQTGVTLFKLDQGVDTGPILAQHTLPLSSDETATTLYGRVADAHKILIRHVWQDLSNDHLKPQFQNEELATEWPGRRPEDGEISPMEMDCAEVDRLVRAITHPYPGAFLTHGRMKYKIWSGTSHYSEYEPDGLAITNGVLSFNLSDGIFRATEWEKEHVV